MSSSAREPAARWALAEPVARGRHLTEADSVVASDPCFLCQYNRRCENAIRGEICQEMAKKTDGECAMNISKNWQRYLHLHELRR